MLAPDTRQHRRRQAEKPVIDLSEFLEPLLSQSNSMSNQGIAPYPITLINNLG